MKPLSAVLATLSLCIVSAQSLSFTNITTPLERTSTSSVSSCPTTTITSILTITLPGSSVTITVPYTLTPARESAATSTTTVMVSPRDSVCPIVPSAGSSDSIPHSAASLSTNAADTALKSGSVASSQDLPTTNIPPGGDQSPHTPAKSLGNSATARPGGPSQSAVPLPILSLGGVTYTANSASEFDIAGLTLGPNEPLITFSGTILSLAANGGQVLASAIGADTASTFQVLAPPQRSPYATVTNAALPSPLTLTADQPIVIAGQTFSPGVTKTISGTPYRLATDGNKLVVGSSTINLPVANAYTTITNALLASPLSITSGQPIIIAGTTLIPGAVETISGTPYSLAVESTALVVGSSTIPLPPTGSAYTTLTNPILHSPLPLTSGQPLVIAGTTLIPGAVETISGTPYSLAIGSSALVVGSSTITLSPGGGGQSSGFVGGTGGGDGAAGPTSTAYTTNASYTGPVYLGTGVSRESSGWMWLVPGVTLSATLLVL